MFNCLTFPTVFIDVYASSSSPLAEGCTYKVIYIVLLFLEAFTATERTLNYRWCLLSLLFPESSH